MEQSELTKYSTAAAAAAAAALVMCLSTDAMTSPVQKLQAIQLQPAPSHTEFFESGIIEALIVAAYRAE